MEKTRNELQREGHQVVVEGAKQLNLYSQILSPQGQQITWTYKNETDEGRLLATVLPSWNGWLFVWEQLKGPGDRYRLLRQQAGYIMLEPIYADQEVSRRATLLMPSSGPGLA